MLDSNLDPNFRKGDAKTDVFGSDAMLQAAPVDRIPNGPTTPEIAGERRDLRPDAAPS